MECKQVFITTFNQEDLEKILDDRIEEGLMRFFGNNEKTIKSLTENTENIETLDVKDVMRLFDLKRTTLWYRMKDGSLPYHRLGRKLVFIKSEIIESIKQNKGIVSKNQ